MTTGLKFSFSMLKSLVGSLSPPRYSWVQGKPVVLDHLLIPIQCWLFFQSVLRLSLPRMNQNSCRQYFCSHCWGMWKWFTFPKCLISLVSLEKWNLFLCYKQHLVQIREHSVTYAEVVALRVLRSPIMQQQTLWDPQKSSKPLDTHTSE